VLDVSRTLLGSTALADLAKQFPNLFHLNLEECSGMTEEALKACFSLPCPSLTSLNLSWNSG
jgi:Ran GTPase-activating protein (RanGAP) involved in mRNA processing and transport